MFNIRAIYHLATTWALSFENVEAQSLAAADLLRACAFLSPEAIPEELFLQGSAVLGTHLEPVTGDVFLLNQATEVLQAYSLLRRDPEMRMLSVHRLVQAVLKDEMDEATKKEWMERVIRAVTERLPQVEHEQWVQWERLVVQALVCAEEMKPYEIAFPEATKMLQKTGWYVMDRGRYAEAQGLLERALSLSEQQQGPAHLDTARDAATLAELYRAQGKYSEAEPLYERALAICEQELGPGHPHTAGSLNNLAAFYWAQGKYGEAEPLYRRALEIREQELGPGHPDTARSLNNLAALYQAQGKYTEVESLFRRALEIYEQSVGTEHPDTATTIFWLAVVAQQQKRYAEALGWYERAWKISKHVLGVQHSMTQDLRNSYAGLLRTVGREEEAAALEAEGG